jgi:uncharacterized protein (DUF433 family)
MFLGVEKELRLCSKGEYQNLHASSIISFLNSFPFKGRDTHVLARRGLTCLPALLPALSEARRASLDRVIKVSRHQGCQLRRVTLVFATVYGSVAVSKNITKQDLRELPAYGLVEAAAYLRLPKSTLRAWMLGQQHFRAVIDIADRAEKRLSFINLVEAFVLAGIRREHSIPLPKVRSAVAYLRRAFKTRRPLAEEQFETDGLDLFVEKFGTLIGATQDGQMQMREVIRDRLKRVRRDPHGLPEKIVLFPAPAPLVAGQDKSGDIVIDPRYSFGRPVLDGYGVRTAVLAERFYSGETVEALSMDYGVPSEVVQNALRSEPRAA